MGRMIFAAIASLAMLFSLELTNAYEAPWCAVSKDGDHWDCQYRSLEECRPNVLAGNRGWCNPNPSFVAEPAELRRSGNRRSRPQ